MMQLANQRQREVLLDWLSICWGRIVVLTKVFFLFNWQRRRNEGLVGW